MDSIRGRERGNYVLILYYLLVTIYVQVNEQPIKAFKEGRVASIPLIMVRKHVQFYYFFIRVFSPICLLVSNNVFLNKLLKNVVIFLGLLNHGSLHCIALIYTP